MGRSAAVVGLRPSFILTANNRIEPRAAWPSETVLILHSRPPIPATQMATTSTKKRQETGRRLREERERLGYTPQQIAQLLGVPIDVYARFESGEAIRASIVCRDSMPAALTFSTSLPTNGISSWKKKTNFCFVFANFHSAAAPLSLRHSMH